MKYKKVLLPIMLILLPLVLLILTSGGTVSPMIKLTNGEDASLEPAEEPKSESSMTDNNGNSGEVLDEDGDHLQYSDITQDNIDESKDRINMPRGGVDTQREEYNIHNKESTNRDNNRPKIIPSPVYAEISHRTELYSTIKGEVVGEVEAGQKVEILQDRTWAWYEISFDDTIAWVKSDALNIPPDPPTDTTRLTDQELEDFLNNREFKSDTDYFLWVDIHRQLVYAFNKVDTKWRLIRTMPCATGINKSPTTRGQFTISADRDTWMYTKRLGSGGKYWVRFNNTYLFHSVAFAEDGQTIIDDTLGVRSSAGCIRLSLEDSKWIYDNAEEGTGVWVN